MKRRIFLHSIGAGLSALGFSSLDTRAGNGRNEFVNATESILANPAKNGSDFISLLPPALKEGSTIGITAPASGVYNGEIQEGIALLKASGYSIVLGNTLTRKYGYLSAPDTERAAEFMEFVERPDIDCILCARGGYGVMRILPMLDFGVIRSNPKIIIGYSDITALLVAITKLSNVITYHGPVASSTFDSFTVDYFKRALCKPVSDDTIQSGTEEFKPITFSDPRMITLTDGVAKGRLTGGNLSMIVATLGTPYEIDTKDSLLFLEDIAEEPYRIDRMLTQLWLAGKLQQCSGIILGQFKNCEAKRIPGFEVSFSLQEVLESRITSLGIPAVHGLPIGHVKSKMTIPLGVMAELNAAGKSFTILESPVAFS
ncbi:MAG: LD-carboxypeptidase [Ignavibacteria bacterium]